MQRQWKGGKGEARRIGTFSLALLLLMAILNYTRGSAGTGTLAIGCFMKMFWRRKRLATLCGTRSGWESGTGKTTIREIECRSVSPWSHLTFITALGGKVREVSLLPFSRCNGGQKSYNWQGAGLDFRVDLLDSWFSIFCLFFPAFFPLHFPCSFYKSCRQLGARGLWARTPVEVCWSPGVRRRFQACSQPALDCLLLSWLPLGLPFLSPHRPLGLGLLIYFFPLMGVSPVHVAAVDTISPVLSFLTAPQDSHQLSYRLLWIKWKAKGIYSVTSVLAQVISSTLEVPLGFCFDCCT